MSAHEGSPRAATVGRGVDRDVPEVVRLHLESFPSFFLSFLGPRFLTEFYLSLVAAPQGILVVARDGGDLVGFAAGASDQRAFFRWMLKHRRARFAVASASGALRNPRTIPRLVRALRRDDQAQEAATAASLLSIGVGPSRQGTGIGSVVMSGFESELSGLGIEDYCLTTDAEGNDLVNGFYARHGHIAVREFRTHEGRLMREYRKHMGPVT